MAYTLTTASQATGKSKSTILRAIQSGRISAVRDDATGGWLIDASELFRVYPQHSVAHQATATVPLSPHNGPLRVRNATAAIQAKLEAAETRIADKEAQLAEARDQISDLRRRLDSADEERRRLTMVLADLRAKSDPVSDGVLPAPARRSWWPWRRKFGIAAVVWVAACGPALAMENGKVLLEDCLKPAGSSGRGYCLGYVTGVANALQLIAVEVCVPEQKTRRQVANVVVRYLQAHPERGHHLAAALVRAALVEAFPCQR